MATPTRETIPKQPEPQQGNNGQGHGIVNGAARQQKMCLLPVGADLSGGGGRMLTSITNADVLLATLTGALKKRLTRLVEQREKDQAELERIYAILGVPDQPTTDTALSNDGKNALRDAETRAELTASLEGLCKAMGRHREEGEAIEQETLYLRGLSQRIAAAEAEAVGRDVEDFTATMENLRM